MTADTHTSIRASRRRVARSRGALSGLAVFILGLWAALVPFIGPYIDLAYTPSPNDAWNWTAARGWLDVLPGAAAVLGGLLLLASASRLMTLFGGWLAALGGAWLVIGSPLAPVISLNAGSPDPAQGSDNQAVTALLFFYAVGAAILFFGSLALGRVSVLSVRDVRAAERRAETAEAERQAALEAAATRDPQRAGADDGVRANRTAYETGRRADEPVGTRNGTANGTPNQYGPGQYPAGPYGTAQQPATQNPAGYPSAPPPNEG